MRRLMCAVLMVGCLARLASAEDGTQKSETAATALSISAGLVLPAGLVLAADNESGSTRTYLVEGAIAAILLGPTAGHWYAGRGWTDATTVRIAGAAAGVAGVALLSTDCDGSCTITEVGGILVAGSAIALVGGALYDAATAGRSAREYNARQLVVTPVALPAAGGGTAMGVGVGGTF